MSQTLLTTAGLLAGSVLTAGLKPLVLLRLKRKHEASVAEAAEPVTGSIPTIPRGLPERLRSLARHGRIKIQEVSTRPKTLPTHVPDARAHAMYHQRTPGATLIDNPAPDEDTVTLHTTRPTAAILRAGTVRNRWWHRLMDEIQERISAIHAARIARHTSDEVQRWWASGIRTDATAPTYRDRRRYVGSHHHTQHAITAD